MSKLANVENIDTGVEFNLTESDYNTFKSLFIFKGWVDDSQVVDEKSEPVAQTDIHQMNKAALIKEAKKLKLQVSDKMTVAKLKEAILDHKASLDDDVVEI